MEGSRVQISHAGSSQVGALTITTRQLPDPGALLSWLPTPQGTMSWVSGGDGLVGWGQAARFAARGADRFAQAQRWWSKFTATVRVHDELGVLGTGPVAFTSMAFADSPGNSVLIVPRVLVGRREEVSWMTTVGDSVPARRPVTAPRGVRYLEGAVNDDAHRRSVAAAVARIRAGELAKVVLARDLVATAEAPLDERYLLARLAEGYLRRWRRDGRARLAVDHREPPWLRVATAESTHAVRYASSSTSPGL